jgi:hypothetical protein
VFACVDVLEVYQKEKGTPAVIPKYMKKYN